MNLEIIKQLIVFIIVAGLVYILDYMLLRKDFIIKKYSFEIFKAYLIGSFLIYILKNYL